MTTMDRDQALDILKSRFPRMENMKIVCNTVADGEAHYSSNVNHFTIEYTQDGKLQQMRVIMKVPVSGAFSNLCENMNILNREIILYEVVLPKVTKYLDKSLTPAHLHTTESKILVLEDVTALGYESGEKLPLFNLNQTQGVLTALADFHAASHILYKEYPHFLKHLLSPCIPGAIFSKWGPVLLELLKRQNETALIPKVRRGLAFLEKDDDAIRSSMSQSKYKFVVLNHGDCRKDNLLLKHDFNNQLEGVQFVDFQLSVWSSPLIDIFFFFTNSVPISLIESHYDELINGYLHELNRKLEKLNCNSSYERVDFEKDIINLPFYSLFCLLSSCLLLDPRDLELKKKTLFGELQIDSDHLCDLCLNDDTFVHGVYSWLKFWEKLNVFENY